LDIDADTGVQFGRDDRAVEQSLDVHAYPLSSCVAIIVSQSVGSIATELPARRDRV
jgi:hypothetical protein